MTDMDKSAAAQARAQEARLAGDDRAAIELAREALAADPDNAEAQSLLGLCLFETTQGTEGADLVEGAIDLAKTSWRARLNLSVLREMQGDAGGAVAHARAATGLGAERFEPWGRLGDLLGRLEDFEGAANALGRALTIYPGHPILALRLAAAYAETDEIPRALNALDQVDALTPGNPEALRLRAQLIRECGEWEKLADVAQQWLAAAPDEEEARIAHAYAMGQQGYHKRAAEIYAPLAEALPAKAEHLAAMGRMYLNGHDIDASRQWFERALAADPSCAEANFGLGRLKTYLGKLDEARDHCHAALIADPEHIETYAQLSEIVGGRLDDHDLGRLEALAANEATTDDKQAIALFAIGDVRHRRKDRAEAFAAWSAANKAKLSYYKSDTGAQFDSNALRDDVDRLINWFDEDPAPATRQSQDADVATPIFIVGMPRSGTTLLESILAAHPDVSPAGELPAMPFIHQHFLAWAESAGWTGGPLPENLRDDWRAAYFHEYENFNVTPARFVTDKQPSNIFSAGLIRLLFPAARIIHIRRNPVETGFSIYRRNFARQWSFANRMQDIADYYGQYARIAAHWERILGGEMAFIQYESLVQNFEAETRRLVDFCGLPWNDACLEFYKQDRTVITFSATQVRRPPSTEHLNSTSPYEDFLAPLRDGLAAAGIDLTTGAPG